MRFLIIIFSILWLPLIYAATPVYFLTEDGLNPSKMTSFEYLTSPTREESLEQVKQRSDWKISGHIHPVIENSRHVLWIRYSVINHSDHALWALAGFRDPNMDMNAFYIQRENGKVDFSHFPKSSKDNLQWYDVIPGTFLSIDPGETVMIYIEQQGITSPSNRFMLMTDQNFGSLSFNTHLFFGTYWGCAIVSIILSCMFLVAFREKFYFVYALYSFSFLFLGITNHGLWNVWFRSGTGIEASYLQKISELLPVIPGIIMAQLFLATKQHMPRIHYALYFPIGFTVLTMAVRLFGHLSSNQEQLLLSSSHLPVLALILWASWHRARAGDRGAALFCAAWGILTVSILLWGITMFEKLPDVLWLLHAPFWGQMGEFIVLTLATIYRINELQKTKMEASLARQHNEDLQMLLRVISHDLVNPLAVIHGLAELNMMQINSGNPSHPEHWFKVHQCAQHQRAIIDHVRKMQSLNDKKEEITLVPIGLAQACEDVIILFEERLRDKQITFEFELDDIKNAFILADYDSLIHQVLANIFSNAIKFSFHKDTISVKGGMIDESVWLDVIDRGMGIPAEIIENLFHPKISTTRKGTSGEKGTGFGMPVVKAYMDRFHGSILVESREQEDNPTNHGTRIRLSFKKTENTAATPDQLLQDVG